MLMIDNEAPKRRQDLRPCEVDGDKAYFHGWITVDKIFLQTGNIRHPEIVRRRIEAGEMVAGCSMQTARTVYALIEYADGEVAKVDPESVRFTD